MSQTHLSCLYFSFKNIIYLYYFICVCRKMAADTHRDQRFLVTSTVVSCLMCVLGTKLRSSARVICVLKPVRHLSCPLFYIVVIRVPPPPHTHQVGFKFMNLNHLRDLRVHMYNNMHQIILVINALLLTILLLVLCMCWWLERDGSVVKSMCCFCRGPKLDLQ